MVYSIRVAKKYFPILVNLCKDYKSYRECVIREIEKQYNIKIYSSSKSHEMKTKNNIKPQAIYIIIYDQENKKLEELAKQLNKSKYEIIMSVLKY
jgi:hypothetical protein